MHGIHTALVLCTNTPRYTGGQSDVVNAQAVRTSYTPSLALAMMLLSSLLMPPDLLTYATLCAKVKRKHSYT
jgi:hypothetical protein